MGGASPPILLRMSWLASDRQYTAIGSEREVGASVTKRTLPRAVVAIEARRPGGSQQAVLVAQVVTIGVGALHGIADQLLDHLRVAGRVQAIDQVLRGGVAGRRRRTRPVGRAGQQVAEIVAIGGGRCSGSIVEAATGVDYRTMH
jgi:hypothetical protein